MIARKPRSDIWNWGTGLLFTPYSTGLAVLFFVHILLPPFMNGFTCSMPAKATVNRK